MQYPRLLCLQTKLTVLINHSTYSDLITCNLVLLFTYVFHSFFFMFSLVSVTLCMYVVYTVSCNDHLVILDSEAVISLHITLSQLIIGIIIMYRNNSNSTRTKLTFQLTPAAINGIVSGRSTVAPRYTVFDVFQTV